MIYYLVKKTIKATDNNPNFAGEEKTYFLGKGDRVFSFSDAFEFETWGYKRKSDAERCIKRDQQLDDERTCEHFWETISREVISMEVGEV